jgi:hypothetical protein
VLPVVIGVLKSWLGRRSGKHALHKAEASE